MTNFAIDLGAGIRDITTLSYWGSVIIETNTTGFAMEFIGDMNDSMTPAVSYMCKSVWANSTSSKGHTGGDCGAIQSSGVNLQ